MEYIAGLLLMIWVGLIAQRTLPMKWREYVTCYWVALFACWVHVLITKPYVLARILDDLARLSV